MTLDDAQSVFSTAAETGTLGVNVDPTLSGRLQSAPAPYPARSAALTKVRDFDTSDIAVAERFDAWRDSFNFFYDAKRASVPTDPANWRHQAWYMDDVLLTMHDLGPFVGHRGPDQIKHDMGYDLLVRYVREGTQHSLHDNVPVVMTAGQVYVYRADHQFSTLVKDRVKTIAVGLSFASDEIGPDLLPNFLALDAAAASTKILMNVMERMGSAVHGHQPMYEAGLEQQFRAVLHDILAPAPLHKPGHKSAIRARRSAMKKFVDENLDKPGFDVDQLLSAFGASRATIFRDFAEDGGLQHYVTSKRLDRAFRDLAHAQPTRGKIQEIATARGFADVGHFARLFRQQFGITPSDALVIGNLPK